MILTKGYQAWLLLCGVTCSLVATQLVITDYSDLLCYKDNATSRALPSNEGKGYTELDGPASTRNDAIKKCFQVSLKLGHTVFALQKGACSSASDNVPGGSYAKYGESSPCPTGGVGGDLINHVYQVNASLLAQRSDYFNLGCFNSPAATPPLSTNEGKGHPELDGNPSSRTNPIGKCFQVALKLGHPLFAIQGGSCHSLMDVIPGGSYSRHGTPSMCPTTGLGTNLVNNVYQVNATLLPQRSDFLNLGCFQNVLMGNRENQGHPELDGHYFYSNRANPVEKCFRLALRLNHSLFAVTQGACRTGTAVANSYNTPTIQCPTHRRTEYSIKNVYQIISSKSNYVNWGCFKDNSASRALPSNEGKGYAELDGAASTRIDSINKCFRLSLRLNHTVFAVQGGACYSAKDTIPNGSFARYGIAAICPSDGRGSSTSLINNVYHVSPQLFPQSSNYTNLGCFKDDRFQPILRSNEGKGYPELQESISTRTDAINKCHRVALKLNHTIFALQNGACYSNADYAPDGSYTQIGPSNVCPTSGLGDINIYHVYRTKGITGAQSFPSLGCWNDAPPNEFEAIRFLANISSSVADPIGTCAGVAQAMGRENITVFALQTYSGNASVLKCSGQRDIVPGGTYTTYGAASSCPSKGTGAANINHVYHVKDAPKLEFNWDNLNYTSYGCYRTSRTLDTSEIDKNRNKLLTPDDCYAQAIQKGHPVFLVNPFYCWTGYDFVPGGDYSLLGATIFCRHDGLGESLGIVNTHHVYLIKNIPEKRLRLWDLPRLSNVTPYAFSSLGCSISLVAMMMYRSYEAPAEGDFSFVDPNDCYQKALARKHNLFVIMNQDRCITSLDIIPGGNYSSLFNMGNYGDGFLGMMVPSQQKSACASHYIKSAQLEGLTQQTFQVNNAPINPDIYTKSSNWSHVGCYVYLETPGAVNNEGKHSLLTDWPETRLDAIQKCYQVAKSLNHTSFALQLGGICHSSTNVTLFTQRGPAVSCLNDLRGGSQLSWYMYPLTSSGRGANVFKILQ